MVCLTVSAFAWGCGGRAGVTKTTTIPPATRPVAQEATHEQILDRYSALSQSLKSLNATAQLKPSAGSAYTGVISEYHEVKAFILASRPYNIRMIGQVPIAGTTVFDMASDGHDFEVSIPPKNQFLIGPVSLKTTTAKPIENLRPQHLVDALLWPEVRKEEVTLFEEFNDENARYYVLTVLRGGYETEILHRIWFDRADFHLARIQSYGAQGVLLSDVRYDNWQPPDNSSSGLAAYPVAIRIERPHDEYRLDLGITKMTANEAISADRFQLQPPQGAEVVHLTDVAEDKKP
jgi:outer membrane lipoprotein-sorting protein